jgi:hypothetical protein
MADVYGIDLSDPGLLRQRSGRWLLVRISGLLASDSRLYRVLHPPKETQ